RIEPAHESNSFTRSQDEGNLRMPSAPYLIPQRAAPAPATSLARRSLLGLQHQPRHPAAADDMRRQDLVDVGGVAIAVPDPLGVDDHGRDEFAAVEAAGGVD